MGLQLSPRIRDLGRITLYRTGPRADFTGRYPASGHLLTCRLNEDLITGMWDDVLRVAASVKGGHASGALVVGKLCSSRRQQNALASAIKEYGALRRTVYAALMWNQPLSSRAGQRAARQGSFPAIILPRVQWCQLGGTARPPRLLRAGIALILLRWGQCVLLTWSPVWSWLTSAGWPGGWCVVPWRRRGPRMRRFSGRCGSIWVRRRPTCRWSGPRGPAMTG